MPMRLGIKLVRHILMKSHAVPHLAVLTSALSSGESFSLEYPLFPLELSVQELNSHLGCSLLE